MTMINYILQTSNGQKYDENKIFSSSWEKKSLNVYTWSVSLSTFKPHEDEISHLIYGWI